MKKTIEDIDVKGKKVLLRVDFNVPLDENGNVADDTRILKEIPTIKYLLTKGAKLIVCSHLGRPDGNAVQSLSLVPVAKILFNLLPATKIKFAFNCIGEYTEKMANSLKEGELLLLENLRFHKGEEKNDPVFAKKLAKLGDIFVNDAFGVAHRNHASTTGVARLLPNAVGFLMGKEINTILDVLDNPVKPFVAVLGGAKVSEKIYIVMNLIKKADTILIGGGMSYTFLKASGFEIGGSLVDDEKLDIAKEILEEAKKRGVTIHLPKDHICGKTFSSAAKPKVIRSQSIPDGFIGMDIGPRTIALYSKIIKKAKTLVWNGPMGVFEFEQFSEGTEKIARMVSRIKGKAVVGGGDSIASLKLLNLDKKIYHISTGGGASLKLLEGGLLPGVEVISNK
ncbi:MAG: phosphoglycerate kinase [Clostridia bacterium]|jgi:phosphoglycerate kinase|nr:phosphoglycerate kinase [Clostridia bacterium]MDD3232056.1 phosphoglycerate kinase [Clostridia bacterium]